MGNRSSAAGSGPSQSVRSAKRASAAVQVLLRMPAASARRAAKVIAERKRGAPQPCVAHPAHSQFLPPHRTARRWCGRRSCDHNDRGLSPVARNTIRDSEKGAARRETGRKPGEQCLSTPP
jgi:hypothetical protein